MGLNYSGRMRANTASMFLNDVYVRTGSMLTLDPAERNEFQLDFAFCILIGDKDKAVPWKEMPSVVHGAKATDTSIVTLKGRNHQPLVHKGWEKVAATVVDWFVDRVGTVDQEP